MKDNKSISEKKVINSKIISNFNTQAFLVIQVHDKFVFDPSNSKLIILISII